MISVPMEKGEAMNNDITVRCDIEITTSCEDENTMYMTFLDGLRLIFREGEYVGWYVCGEG